MQAREVVGGFQLEGAKGTWTRSTYSDYLSKLSQRIFHLTNMLD